MRLLERVRCLILHVGALLCDHQGTLPADYGNITGAVEPPWWQVADQYTWSTEANGWFVSSSAPATSAGPGLRSLSKLACNRCNLTGTIPSTWSGLVNLRELQLSGNNINGTVPRIGGGGMSVLDVSSNRLSALPANPGSWWPRLTAFVGNKNLFAGQLPANWSTWQLEKPLGIQLAGNAITGTLPDAWATAVNASAAGRLLRDQLQMLDLSNNNLTGSIPASWANMTGLDCWSLAGNAALCGAPAAGVVCPAAFKTSVGEWRGFALGGKGGG